jgi:4-hydroxy-tetrahydrodipicolinate synthase
VAGTIDTAQLTALVDRLVSSGVHAIAAVRGWVPVIVGVSDVATAKTIRHARCAQQAGADAVMILPVSYWKLPEREIVQHYASIGQAIEIPIMAYNIPATSGVDMRPELLVRMFPWTFSEHNRGIAMAHHAVLAVPLHGA